MLQVVLEDLVEAIHHLHPTWDLVVVVILQLVKKVTHHQTRETQRKRVLHSLVPIQRKRREDKEEDLVVPLATEVDTEMMMVQKRDQTIHLEMMTGPDGHLTMLETRNLEGVRVIETQEITPIEIEKLLRQSLELLRDNLVPREENLEGVRAIETQEITLIETDQHHQVLHLEVLHQHLQEVSHQDLLQEDKVINLQEAILIDRDKLHLIKGML